MLKTRILTALALLACFIPALFYMPDILWAFMMLGLSLLALWEWGALIGISQTPRKIYVFVCAVLGVILVLGMDKYGFHPFLYQSLKIFMLVTLFWVFVVPMWLAKGWDVRNPWVMMLVGMLVIGALWLALICVKRIDPVLLLIIISTIWIADSAAYFAGKKFGKHKLAITISPGKTWEGVAGALIAVTLFAVLVKCFNGFDSWVIVPILWVLTILGVYGDLFESKLKRQANIKDSGQILPGHGGILDRIDGVIPALPIGILLLYIYRYYLTVV